jgi:putative tricarboxylic transport membrane protein
MGRPSDRIFGILGLALAAMIIWRATLIQESFIQDPLGPKAFPIVVAVVMALASAVIVFMPDEEPVWPPLPRLLEIAVAVGVMVAYAQMLPVAGFVIATALAAAFLSWRLGSAPIAACIAGVAISLGIYAVFHLVLGLSLAKGPLGF